jgi:serine/threonine-protein kinase
MEKIVLPRGEWLYDPSSPLGRPGGFGAVFEGVSTSYGQVAVKRLHITSNDAAHREMRIATGLASRTLTHVIPILDAGEDADTGQYFVVMPRAERSLQSDIQAGRFCDVEAARAMLNIADGLLEVNDLVHRDLKPPNILLHEGAWKVADFGIARFVEDATSLRTLKGCLSPPYAAPEQFQFIHATSATDVYALGCIGYALLTGRPPFPGPTEPDYFDQHLHADPPALPSAVAPRLQTLLSMMLRKPPRSRPSLSRVKAILSEVVQGASGAGPNSLGILAQVGSNIAHQQARIEQQLQQAQSEEAIRSQLADTGRKILQDILERLFNRTLNEAPNAQRDRLAVALGRGRLEASLAGVGGHRRQSGAPAGLFRESKWDVITAEEIVVHQQQPEYPWSASLWYCRMPNTTEYRWYEASYWSLGRTPSPAPFSLSRSPRDADLAAAPIMHLYQLAFGPVAIDDENEGDFIERWATVFAVAAQGKLGYPRSLPLHETFWRNSFVA